MKSYRAIERGASISWLTGAEGMGSVMLANAVLMSQIAGRAIDLPLDGDAYVSLLDDLVAKSTFVKPEVVGDTKTDVSKSF